MAHFHTFAAKKLDTVRHRAFNQPWHATALVLEYPHLFHDVVAVGTFNKVLAFA
jgi:hypothetical protein